MPRSKLERCPMLSPAWLMQLCACDYRLNKDSCCLCCVGQGEHGHDGQSLCSNGSSGCRPRFTECCCRACRQQLSAFRRPGDVWVTHACLSVREAEYGVHSMCECMLRSAAAPVHWYVACRHVCFLSVLMCCMTLAGSWLQLRRVVPNAAGQ